LTEVEIGWEDGLMLGFRLPPGSYATEVLREVMKSVEP
jgi:tRNA(Glu) U13 pseudouridine synthase TruD